MGPDGQGSVKDGQGGSKDGQGWVQKVKDRSRMAKEGQGGSSTVDTVKGGQGPVLPSVMDFNSLV